MSPASLNIRDEMPTVPQRGHLRHQTPKEREAQERQLETTVRFVWRCCADAPLPLRRHLAGGAP